MDIYWIYPYDLWRHLEWSFGRFASPSGHVFRGMALEPPEPSSRPEVRVFCQNDQKSCSCWRCGFGRKTPVFFRVGYRRTKARKQNAPPEFRGQIWEFIYLHGIKIIFFLWIYRIEKNTRVTGDVFVDGYDWCWCCLCAFLVPLFGRIPGPKDIMIQNDWLMAVCLRLIKENADVKGFDCSAANFIALLRMRVYTSSTMANFWVSTPWTEIIRISNYWMRTICSQICTNIQFETIPNLEQP